MGILAVSFFSFSIQKLFNEIFKNLYKKKRHSEGGTKVTRNFKNNQAHRFYLKLNVKFIFAIKKIKKVTFMGRK